MANNLAAFNSEAWSSRLVKKIDQINVMRRLVNTDWEGDLRQNKTVHVRTAGNISLSSYTRGTVISYQDLTPTNESFTVNDGEYFAFNVDDIDRAQSDVNAMDVYMKRAVVGMSDTIETKLVTAVQAGVTVGGSIAAAPTGTGAILVPVISGGAVTSVTITNGGTGYSAGTLIGFVGGNGNGATATVTLGSGVITAVTVTAGGNNYTRAPKARLTTSTPIALDSSATAGVGIYPVLVAARGILTKNNVPNIPGSRWLVVDPDTASLLLNDTAHFVRATQLGDQVVQRGFIGGEEVTRTREDAPGFIGMIAGFSVYEMAHLVDDGTQKYLMAGDMDACSYAAQITEIEALRLQTTFANAVRGLLLHDTFVPAEASKRIVTIRANSTAT